MTFICWITLSLKSGFFWLIRCVDLNDLSVLLRRYSLFARVDLVMISCEKNCDDWII